jgi:hypothetical protein
MDDEGQMITCEELICEVNLKPRLKGLCPFCVIIKGKKACGYG